MRIFIHHLSRKQKYQQSQPKNSPSKSEAGSDSCDDDERPVIFFEELTLTNPEISLGFRDARWRVRVRVSLSESCGRGTGDYPWTDLRLRTIIPKPISVSALAAVAEPVETGEARPGTPGIVSFDLFSSSPQRRAESTCSGEFANVWKAPGLETRVRGNARVRDDQGGFNPLVNHSRHWQTASEKDRYYGRY